MSTKDKVTPADEAVEELEDLTKSEEEKAKERAEPDEVDLLEKALLDMEEFDEEEEERLRKAQEEEGEPSAEELKKSEEERAALVEEHGEELVAATEAYEAMEKAVHGYAERTESAIGDQNAAIADLTGLVKSMGRVAVAQARNTDKLLKSVADLQEENESLKKSLEEIGGQPTVPGAHLGLGIQRKETDPSLPEKGEVIDALSKAIQDDNEKYGHLSRHLQRISVYGVNEDTFPKSVFTDSLCEEIGLPRK